MPRDNSYMIGNQFARGNGPNQTSFKPGLTPWNKGKKTGTPPGSEKGQFKKGQRGKSYVPVGTVTIRKDKQGKLRRWIKTTDEGPWRYHWKMYALWLWESQNGPITPGKIIHHIDGDSLNDAISNFEEVDRAQHIEKHRMELGRARQRPNPHPGKGYIAA